MKKYDENIYNNVIFMICVYAYLECEQFTYEFELITYKREKQKKKKIAPIKVLEVCF